MAHAVDNNWLIGKWELHRDPDGSEKDWLEFRADGTVTNISPKGRQVRGLYVVHDDLINTTYQHKGRRISIPVGYASDKRSLLLYSKRTKNTSVYKKLDEPTRRGAR